MRKEIEKWTSFMEDFSIEEAVNDFFDHDWDPTSWDETCICLDSYIADFERISDEEIELLKRKVKEKFDDQVLEMGNEEKSLLKDRKSIINWISSLTDDEEEGNPGYILTPEEILDIILENGRK